MKQLILTLLFAFTCGAEAVAALAALGAEEAFVSGGSAGTLALSADAVVYDSARAVEPDAYRFAHARLLRGAEGDFTVSARTEVARLDHWNSFRLTVRSLAENAWRAELVRENREPGRCFLTARMFVAGEKTSETSLPFRAADFSLRLARRGTRLAFVRRAPDGDWSELAAWAAPDTNAVSFAFAFDTPKATQARVRISDVTLVADREPPDAWMPVYASEPLRIPATRLAGGRDSSEDGLLCPGDCLLLAAQAPATACDWALEWRSEGRVRIRMVQLGSAETLQLSDNVVWDDVNDAVPDGLSARRRSITPWIRRFNSDIRWPLSHPYASGLFFLQVSSAETNRPCRVRDLHLVCRPLRGPHPLPAGTTGVTEYPVSGKIGAVEVVHAAGRQPKGSPDTLAGWLYVYADGTTACAYATLRWNCGVLKQDDIEDPITPDMTWFGPPGFAWGEPLYERANEHATHWNTWYRWRFVNPHPEKAVAKVQMFRLPGDRRDYRVRDVKPVAARDFALGLVEPDRADILSDEKMPAHVYAYRASTEADPELTRTIVAEKGASCAKPVGEARMDGWHGRFAAGNGVFSAGEETGVPPGPLTLAAGFARSSRLSLMPRQQGGEKPFHYTMICGGHDHAGEYDRMRRCGYDEAKIHVAWDPAPDGTWNLGSLDARVAKIARAGMDVALRNTVPMVKAFEGRLGPVYVRRDGADAELKNGWMHDTADPFYRERLVDFYRCMGRFAATHPRVKGINANYGQRLPVAIPGPKPALVWNANRLRAFGAWRTERGLPACALTPDAILADAGLLADYARWNEEVGSSLIEAIATAIRDEAKEPHLTFNVNFHPIENALSGQTFAEYLRVGLRHGPGSLFHETSERYSLSFVKWMAAARTCGLVYGDECCQNPPSYEQAAMAYMWMGMMQCFEANYCQWWGGRPATENVVQFKAFHRILMDAAYLPDPVALALSFETGFAEVGDTVRVPLHTRTAHHYALAHFLRELNVNPDRYMLDAFPDRDGNVKTRLLVDDVTRSMSADFGARIRRFVEAGGVYLASTDTDCLNGHAFLKTFGFTADELAVQQDATNAMPVAERACGAGRVVLLRKPWSFDWDPGHPEPERRAAHALLTRLGAFEPLAQTSSPVVFATPYRAPDGAGLVSLINICCEDRAVEVTLARAFAGERPPKVLDLGTGAEIPAVLKDGRWTLAVTVGRINATVLRVM